jgi:DNA polymerase V
MDTLDAINQKFGRGTAGFAASGWKANPAWGMKQKNLSPCFTTRWSELPTTNCDTYIYKAIRKQKY